MHPCRHILYLSFFESWVTRVSHLYSIYPLATLHSGRLREGGFRLFLLSYTTHVAHVPQNHQAGKGTAKAWRNYRLHIYWRGNKGGNKEINHALLHITSYIVYVFERR